MDLKSLLEDDNFLIGMGLLSAGSKGQSIGEAGLTSIKDAAAIKKSLTGKTKDKFRLLSRTEIENNAALDNNSNYQMNMTTGELKIVPINKVSEKKQKDQFRLLSKDEVITDYPALDPNKTYQLNETTGKVELFKKESAKMFESKYEAGLGTQASENVKKIRLDGENAIEANTNLNLINSISEDLNTGAGANILQNIAKWGQRFDIDLNWLSSYAQDKTVSNSEILQVLSSAQLFAAISQTKGSISEKEMAVFEGITTNLAMSKAGIQGNIKIQEAINDRRILKANMLEEWIGDGSRPDQQKTVNGKKQNFNQMWTEYVEAKDSNGDLINPLFSKEELEELTDLSKVSANEGDGIEIITDPKTKIKYWVLPGGNFEPVIAKSN
tara:strand:- start:2633 stop:3781 length:1149 start_codon:yes stop_codon:yes gene_type:complete